MDVEALARELYEAGRTASPVPFIKERYPELDWDGARAIARATDDLRRAAGEVQIGWKLGWTSQAMRDALGVDRPNWGTLWQRQRRDRWFHMDNSIHPKLEPEFVWRCGADLSGPEVTAADVDAAGGAWALGIEVVDPRFPSFAFDPLDNTADNSSSAVIAVGEFVEVQPHSTLDDTVVELSDGTEARTGPGSQAMGSPAEAVAWLVRQLASEDEHLAEGQIVFTGGLTGPIDVERRRSYKLRSGGFGTVEIRCW